LYQALLRIKNLPSNGSSWGHVTRSEILPLYMLGMVKGRNFVFGNTTSTSH